MKPIKNDIEVSYTWKRKFAFVPHLCKLSGNLVWLKHGMRGEYSMRGWAGELHIYRWHDEFEHLTWAITNA